MQGLEFFAPTKQLGLTNHNIRFCGFVFINTTSKIPSRGKDREKNVGSTGPGILNELVKGPGGRAV